jgi:hypothetical protein
LVRPNFIAISAIEVGSRPHAVAANAIVTLALVKTCWTRQTGRKEKARDKKVEGFGEHAVWMLGKIFRKCFGNLSFLF